MNAMKINQIFIFACVGSIVFNYSLFLILSKLIPNAFQAGEGSHFVRCPAPCPFRLAKRYLKHPLRKIPENG
jgi:hypothetical protein